MARPKAGVTFHDRVRAGTVVNHKTGCWEWTGHKDECGYGRIYRDGRLVRLHRSLWEEQHGPIPPKMSVCHHCDNPGCINLAHLFLGTHQDNMRDMFAKGRRRILRGSQQGCAKLDEQKVAEIKRSLAAGATGASLSRKFGVTEPIIYAIKVGRRWTHVEAA